MPNNSAFSDIVLKWQQMVINVLDDMNSGVLPNLEVYRGPLAEILDDVLELSSELKIRRGVKQQRQKELDVLKRKGQYHASKLASALKAHYGPQSEELLKYGIPPVRARLRPAGESEGPTPVPEPEPIPEGGQVEGALETAKAPEAEEPSPAPEVKPASQES